MVENKACFLATSPLSLAPTRGGACSMAAHRVGGRMGDIFTAHERRKKEVRFGRDRGSCLFAARVAPRSRRFLRLFPLVGRRSGERGDTKKRPRRESTPLIGGLLAAGESRKSHFVLTSRGKPRGLRHSARRPWRQIRCPRRSLRPHRRGRGRRGARVARFRGRAPRERAKRCAFRRR